MNSTLVPGLIDTGIMVACVGGLPPATSFFISLSRICAPPFSRLSVLELLTWCQSDADRILTLRFIGGSQVIDLTDVIVRRALGLLTTIPLPTALTASDALIAATALEQGLPLYTLDPARFASVPGLIASRPY